MNQTLIDTRILEAYRKGSPEIRKALIAIYGELPFGNLNFEAGLKWLWEQSTKDFKPGTTKTTTYPFMDDNAGIINITVSVERDDKANTEGVGRVFAGTLVRELYER